MHLHSLLCSSLSVVLAASLAALRRCTAPADDDESGPTCRHLALLLASPSSTASRAREPPPGSALRTSRGRPLGQARSPLAPHDSLRRAPRRYHSALCCARAVACSPPSLKRCALSGYLSPGFALGSAFSRLFRPDFDFQSQSEPIFHAALVVGGLRPRPAAFRLRCSALQSCAPMLAQHRSQARLCSREHLLSFCIFQAPLELENRKVAVTFTDFSARFSRRPPETYIDLRIVFRSEHKPTQ